MGLLGKVIVFVLIVVNVILSLFLILRNHSFPILHPAGTVALQERNVLFLVGGIGLSIVIPVVLTTFFIAWKYREDNPKAKYTPDWNKNLYFEFFRWGLFITVIAIIASITWISAHRLDPYKPLSSTVKPLRVQVVALQWKWLFIYPEQHIATVNYLVIPEKTPIDFDLTADAPMNSFWIPALGGQVYAMSGMSTQTHLMADHTDEFAGSDAEISGKEFAKMRFVTKSVTQSEFDHWIKSTQQTQTTLNFVSYTALAVPGNEPETTLYSLEDTDLYNTIVAKYMSHSHSISLDEHDEHDDHE